MSLSTKTVYISAQQTNKLSEYVGDQSFDYIGASTPPFNLYHRNNSEKVNNMWKDKIHESVDVPVFGPAITQSLRKLFNIPSFKEFVEKDKEYRVPLPEMGFNTFWASRVAPYTSKRTGETQPYGAVQPLLDLLVQHGEVKSVEHICKFVNRARFVVSSNHYPLTEERWNSFVNDPQWEFPEDWKSRLHYDTLLQLFGVSDETAKTIRNSVDNSVYHKSGKYLSSILNTLSLVVPKNNKGCFTDVVNGVFWMSRKSISDGNNDKTKEICNVLDTFTKNLRENNNMFIKNLQTPDYHIEDGENDDELLNVLFRFVRSLQNKEMITVMQLPTNEIFINLGFSLSKRPNTIVIIDKDSRNEEVLISYWNSRNLTGV